MHNITSNLHQFVLCPYNCDKHLYGVLAGSKEKTCDLKPFALLNKTSTEVQEGKSAVSFSAPTLLDDYCKEETTQISVYAHNNGVYCLSPSKLSLSHHRLQMCRCNLREKKIHILAILPPQTQTSSTAAVTVW